MIHSTLFFIWLLLWCLFGSLQVQNLIERCLQLYMNPKEVVETLLAQAKIEPGFTELGSNFSSVVFFVFVFFYYPCFTALCIWQLSEVLISFELKESSRGSLCLYICCEYSCISDAAIAYDTCYKSCSFLHCFCYMFFVSCFRFDDYLSSHQMSFLFNFV